MLCSANSLAPWLTEIWHINSPATLIAKEIWYSAVLNNIIWCIALQRCIENIIRYIALQSCIENIIWYIALQRCIESRKIRDGVPPDKCHQGSSSTTVPLNLGSAGFSIKKRYFSFALANSNAMSWNLYVRSPRVSNIGHNHSGYVQCTVNLKPF